MAIIDPWRRSGGVDKKKDDHQIYKKSDEKSSFSLSHFKLILLFNHQRRNRVV
jgi:hypothetical protein